ncbi:MAG: prepilin-type N-terminal cleavage/methylation domain-containing protein [Candidatus Staskawiczbacteria bacterium]|nr:prepilin-type N-terminal cleavage/methylation domain-containing protein [Candidatus Staskawiczbacteria bacterium]
MKTQKGFTIIELIVVIAIIAVLAAIVMINVSGYIAKARNVKRISDVGNYVKALNMYYADKGHFPNNDNSIGCCLGKGMSSDVLSACGNLPDHSNVKCDTLGFSTPANENDLTEYYASPVDTPFSVLSVKFAGYNYTAIDKGGGTCHSAPDCQNFILVYVLQGSNQACGNGASEDLANKITGATICRI